MSAKSGSQTLPKTGEYPFHFPIIFIISLCNYFANSLFGGILNTPKDTEARRC